MTGGGDRAGPNGLRSRRDLLLARTELKGGELCRRYAAEADAWLADLLSAAGEGDVTGLALLAVGGYGRAELAPGSDLDVVLVHGGRRRVEPLADAVWYPVWDEGIRLDHSVRTRKEVLAVAESDLKTALGLLDARVVAGDPDIAAHLGEQVERLWRSRARRWLPLLAEAVEARHGAKGDVAFLLEPELKEGRGGLRDVQALSAAERAAPVLGAARPGAASQSSELEQAAEVLRSVRVELQRPSARPVDRLSLQEQDRVAEALGLRDADELMAHVAAAGRTIAWSSDEDWRRVRSWLKGPRGRAGGRDRPVGAGLILRDGEMWLAPDADPSDAALAFRAAAEAAELGVPLSRPALDELARTVTEPGDPWPPEALAALVALLGTGPAGVTMLETLDQRGILVRVLPEWAAVRNKPQRNAYHRFTVDRHLLETAAGAAALVRRVARPDLLLLAALLHDVGKGHPGDHTVAGVEVVGILARRMGLSAPDASVLVALVRHHLLLADAATRRDLDDPATVEAVARAVGDEGTLELLAALTEADSLATGPAAWGTWKAGLVADLVRRVRAALSGEAAEPPPPLPVPEQRRTSTATAAAAPTVAVDGSKVTVVRPDRPGLLSLVAGVLALHGLDVRSAVAAAGEAAMAVEVFDVQPRFATAPDWAAVEADIAAACEGRLALGAALSERESAHARRRPTAARPVEPRLIIDNEASASATVVEVRAHDGVGVLHRITGALSDQGLDIASARVSTLGAEVVDAFYVRARNGSKLSDPSEIAGLERAVLDRLGPPS